MQLGAIIPLAIVGTCILWIVFVNLRAYCRESRRPFNSRSTGSQVLEGIDLTGKVAIITGSSSGLGLETTKLMVGKGCTVVMANRNMEKAAKARQSIIDSFGSNDDAEQQMNGSVADRLICMQLDLSSLQSVQDFARAFVERKMALNYLDLNAGIMGLPEYRETKEGLEMQWGVCHLGHWYLCQLLLEPVLLPNQTRIVCLSSNYSQKINYNRLESWLDDAVKEKTYMGSQTKEEYKPLVAYGAAKTSNILFAREMAKRYDGQGLVCVSAHPGVIMNTGLADEMNVDCSVCQLCCEMIFCAWCYYDSKSVEQGIANPLRCMMMKDEEIDNGAFYYNCVNASIDNNVPSGAVIRGGDDILAKKLWDVSEAIVQEKGFSLTL